MNPFSITLHYEGNKDVFMRYPALRQVRLSTSFPIFSYDNGDSADTYRASSDNQLFHSRQMLDEKAEGISVPSYVITGRNLVHFFDYYANQMRYLFTPAESQTTEHLKEQLAKLAFNASTEVDSVLGHQAKQTFHHYVLPLIVVGDFVKAGDKAAAQTLPNFFEVKNIEKKVTHNLIILNYDVLLTMLDEGDALHTLTLLQHGLNSTGKLNSLDDLRFRFEALNEVGDLQLDTADILAESYQCVKDNLEDLLHFPVSVQAIELLDIAGTFALKTNKTLFPANFSCYDLSVSFKNIIPNLNQGVATEESVSIQYDWQVKEGDITQNKVAFAFQDSPIFANHISGEITIRVKGYDGVDLWENSYDKDDMSLSELKIVVPFYAPPALGKQNDAQTSTDFTKKLRGQVIDATGTNSVKSLSIVLQAKQKMDDKLWRIIGAATTDNMGNFTLNYPKGVFSAVQALVSTFPNSPADIYVKTDADSIKREQTIDEGFIYLLLDHITNKDADKEEDCDCHTPKKIGRLPDQEDLINSDSYTQDIGGACMNLSTPNRTLSEYNYMAIVRTSDPDVANYVLTKEITKGIDGQSVEKISFSLGNGFRVKRKFVDFDNPIMWQDAPAANDNLSLYQAVTVAHGHILRFKSVWKADGYSLGDLLYSLPLAPGQKKQIVINEVTHSLTGSESQSRSQNESVAANLLSERNIADMLAGGVGENMRGNSNASTAGISVSGGASYMGMANIGISGGYSTSNSEASQDSARNVVQNFDEKLRHNTTQNAQSYRSANMAVITTVSESERFSTQVEVVANHNHCHSLTMMYFEVLRHYAVYQELANVEECIFVPLLMTHFTAENIYKFRDVLAANLLQRPSSTYLTSPLGENALLRAFDANQRIQTNYDFVDFPVDTYDNEPIRNIQGEIVLRVNLQRPKTRYDRIKSMPIISRTVTHEEFDPEAAAKNIALAPLTFGFSMLNSNTKTVSEQVQERGAIFDSFLQLDANYGSVPPAQCIRVKSFQPSSINIGGISIPVSGTDFFDHSVVDKKMWETYAEMLNYPNVYDMLDYYFAGKLIAEWDEIYYTDMAPILFEKIVDSIKIDFINTDLTSINKYHGGEQSMYLRLSGSTNKTRGAFPDKLNLSCTSPLIKSIKNYITLNIESAKIFYATQHYNGQLFSGYIGDDFLDGVALYIPESADEKRNPRKEDKYLVNELLEHLNSNLEYYNKVLWYNLDADRRYMLLDGFHIQVYDDLNQPSVFKSLASVVRNELIGVAGNALIFPVAPGFKLDRAYIVEIRKEGDQETAEQVSLLDHYKPLSPMPPYRLSVPTKGVFCEAVKGACDACEKVQENTSQDWNMFKPDEPTAINSVQTGTPTITDWKANYKDFAPPIVNIQNAPTEPPVNAGLAGLTTLLGQSGIFKDITGLDQNQKNAMETYKLNQENAKAMADLASKGAMQIHNTANSDKIMNTLNNAKKSGAISEEQYSDLVQKHIQQQIDGGKSQEKKEEKEEEEEKPSVVKAAVDAAKDGRKVKVEEKDSKGKTTSVEIGESEGEEDTTSEEETILAEAKGVSGLKQDKTMACWATVSTMMLAWKNKKSMTIAEGMALAGDKYLNMYTSNVGMAAEDKADFLQKVGLKSEAPASYPLKNYINWLKSYGPLWLTIDSNKKAGAMSPHAWLLTKITGRDDSDGSKAIFYYINPTSGEEKHLPFLDFIKQYEQMVSDLPEGKTNYYLQVVHFMDKQVTGEGGEDAGQEETEDPKVALSKEVGIQLQKAADDEALTFAVKNRESKYILALSVNGYAQIKDKKAVLSEQLAKVFTIFASKATSDRPFGILSLFRYGSKNHGKVEGDYLVGRAVDISQYNGYKIHSNNPEEALKGIVALIADLPPGRYTMGLPRKVKETQKDFFLAVDKEHPAQQPPEGKLLKSNLERIINEDAKMQLKAAFAANPDAKVLFIFPDGGDHLHLKNVADGENK